MKNEPYSKQEYMNRLWRDIVRRSEEGTSESDMIASVMICDYESKLSLGWPKSNENPDT